MSSKPMFREIYDQPVEEVSSKRCHTRALEGAKKPEDREDQNKKWKHTAVEMELIYNPIDSKSIEGRLQRPISRKDDLIIDELDVIMEQMGQVIYDVGIRSSTATICKYRNRVHQSNLRVSEKFQLINRQLQDCQTTLTRIQNFFKINQNQISEHKLNLMQCIRSMNQFNSKVESWLVFVENRSQELQGESDKLSDELDSMQGEATGLAALAGTTLAVGPTAFYIATGTVAASFGTAILAIGSFALTYHIKQERENEDTRERLKYTNNLIEKYSTIIDKCVPILKKGKTICTLLDEHISRNEVIQRTSHLSVAIKRAAAVPFLHHHVLQCDCRALEYVIEDHDITLRIPEGAVPVGKKVHIDIGVAAYGPFTFPKDTQPISPIVWINVKEKDAQLQKPFQLVLPHFLMGLTKERICAHQVEFAKALHNGYVNDKQQLRYRFHYCDSDPLFASSGERSYGVLESMHCCYYCLKARRTPAFVRDTSYCLTRIERSLPSQPQKNEIYFAVTYFLDTCLKALKKQFLQKDGYHVSFCRTFKFKTGRTTEISITNDLSCDSSQCMVGWEPSTAKIKRVEIDFWESSFEEMKLKHEQKIYPPRVKMTVTFDDPDLRFILPIKVTGCSTRDQLDMDITFPLSNYQSTSQSSGPELEPQSRTIHIKSAKPSLRDAFKELYSIASKWKAIGTLLGLEPDTLERLKEDEEEAHDRLQKMLTEWLKLVDPPPTWKHLIEAVRELDKQKAQQISSRIAEKYEHSTSK